MAKQSWRLALLKYLTTPLDGNTPSPSRLNGNKFNSFSLLPNVNTLNDNSDILVKRHDAQLQWDTKRKLLPELPVGSKVGYRNHITNNCDIGIVTAQNARLYQICTEHSTHISHNHIDLKHTNALYKPHTKPSQAMSNFAKSSHANANPPLPSNIRQDDKAKLVNRRISISKTNSSNLTSNRYMTVKWSHFEANPKAYQSNVNFACARYNHCIRFVQSLYKIIPNNHRILLS